MSDRSLDEVDRQILYMLQEDARNNTNTAISERIGVSPSTVGKRIKQLEATGVLKGYHPDVDYDKADFPLRVLFVCTAAITDRADLVDQIRALKGVVSIRELMTGEQNVHVEVVVSNNEELTEMATAIDALPIDINEEILVKHEYSQPAKVFGSANGT